MAINMVADASRTVARARAKPVSTASESAWPAFTSSRMRSKISTLASTAMPTVSTIPAIMDSESGAPMRASTAKVSNTLKNSATEATTPSTP
jgi:hypothetical protein